MCIRDSDSDDDSTIASLNDTDDDSLIPAEPDLDQGEIPIQLDVADAFDQVPIIPIERHPMGLALAPADFIRDQALQDNEADPPLVPPPVEDEFFDPINEGHPYSAPLTVPEQTHFDFDSGGYIKMRMSTSEAQKPFKLLWILVPLFLSLWKWIMTFFLNLKKLSPLRTTNLIWKLQDSFTTLTLKCSLAEIETLILWSMPSLLPEMQDLMSSITLKITPSLTLQPIHLRIQVLIVMLLFQPAMSPNHLSLRKLFQKIENLLIQGSLQLYHLMMI